MPMLICMAFLIASNISDREGNGNPLQCSCLENLMDGGAWWAAVHGVAQSRTRLKRLSSSSFIHTQNHTYIHIEMHVYMCVSMCTPRLNIL